MNASGPETVGLLDAGHENRYWSIKARPRFRQRLAGVASALGLAVFAVLMPVIAAAAWLTVRVTARRRLDAGSASPGPAHALARTTVNRFLDVYPTAIYSPVAKALELGYFARYPAEAPSLEIGIGDGVFAAALSESTGRRISLGTDLIYETLASARPRGIHETVFVSDAQEIPVASGSVATVVMNNLMHHLPDRERIAAEAHKVLRPGGMFLFTDNLVGWNDFMFDNRLLRRLLPASWVRRYTKRKLWLLAQSLLVAPGYWVELGARQGWEVVEVAPFVSRTAMTIASVFEFLNLKFGQPTRPPLRRLLGTGWRRRAMTGLIGRIVDDLIVADEQLCREQGAAFLFVALRKRAVDGVAAPAPALVCPRCKSAFDAGRFFCAACAREYPVVDGIPVLLSYADQLPWLRDYLAYQERRKPREFVT